MRSTIMMGLLLAVVIGISGCGGGGGGTPVIPPGAINTAPVAKAGSAQSVVTGAAVMLDGSGSIDANGDPLSYSWSFISRPAGSSSALSSSTAVTPTFSTDVAGAYELGLVVNDGKVNSTAATVTITAAGIVLDSRSPTMNLHSLTTTVGQAVQTTLYTNDSSGKQISAATNPGSSNSIYTYDEKDRIVLEDYAGNTISYTYNSAGNLQTVTHLDNTNVTYNYDSNNKLISDTYGNGVTTVYSYDSNNRLISMISSNGISESFIWSNGVLVTHTLKRVGMPDSAFTFTYDASNKLTKYSLAGANFDSNGNSSDLVVTYAYTATTITSTANHSDSADTYIKTYSFNGSVPSYDSYRMKNGTIFNGGMWLFYEL